jgi:S1-C subfamily serine protease
VANRAETSDQKAAMLADLEANFAREQASAEAKGEARKARDLGATLALVRTGTWKPAEEPVPSADSPSTPTQWLQGTATVVVNKGLKVENGAAQPDIVIGSGFFVSPDGLLLTNHHVIESEVEPGASPSSKLSVRLPGSKGERLPAKVVGWDKNLDLALLKVEYKPPFVFSLSTVADPVAGQRLRAIGSPGGLEASLTEGIVSSSARPLLALGEVLQIDVAVNPGNSGGPLVDAQGRVVGVIFAGIRDFQGVNFAIPASLVRRVYPLLQAGGRISLPWVGLGLQEDAQGVEVLYVVPRGPGDEAGIRVGDRLTALAGTPFKEIAPAQVRLLDFGTDAVVPVDLIRDGSPLRLWTTLGVRPDLPLKEAALKDLTSRVFPLAFGAVVEDTAQGVDRTFRVKRVWPGTPAEELGLSENDPIEVVDWVVDTKNEVVATQWKVKRRLGGWLESTVQLAVPYQSRLFL